MRIEDSTKLDFSDVLIKPKRSRLGSRKDVHLERSYTFLHSEEEYRGIPIIAANMDHTGTFDMADALVQFKMGTALHKHYTIDNYAVFYQKYLDTNHSFDSQSDTHTWYSMGILPADLEKFNKVVIASPLDITHVCIDVANGYSENMVDFVRKFRKANEHITIMAGNVVTAEMTEALILAGADIVKVGIGPGCFSPGQLVNTKRGLVPIEEVIIGDEVKTHKNRWRKVTNLFNFDDKKEIVKINNIEATPNHEFYVLHKKYKDIVTDENIENYAEWVAAEDLTKDYLLLKQKG